MNEPAAAHRQLYSPQQVYIAALLGSPLAAAWLMRLNFIAFGEAARAAQIVRRGIIFTGIVLVLAYIYPTRTPNLVIPLIYSSIIFIYANSVFARPFATHIAAGGAKGSWWNVVGLSVLCSVALLAFVLAVFLLAAGLGVLPEAPAPA